MKKKLNLNKISVASFTTSLSEGKKRTLQGGEKLTVITCGLTNPIVCCFISELQTACCPASIINCITETTCPRPTGRCTM